MHPVVFPVQFRVDCFGVPSTPIEEISLSRFHGSKPVHMRFPSIRSIDSIYKPHAQQALQLYDVFALLIKAVLVVDQERDCWIEGTTRRIGTPIPNVACRTGRW